MKTILRQALIALLISILVSTTLADEKVINDIDLSNPDHLLQVGRLVSLKSSSLDFGHDWMASPVDRQSHGKQGKRSFLVSEHTFSMRNNKRHWRSHKLSHAEEEDHDNVVPLDKIEELHMNQRKSSSSSKDSTPYSSDTSSSGWSSSSSSAKHSPKIAIAK